MKQLTLLLVAEDISDLASLLNFTAQNITIRRDFRDSTFLVTHRGHIILKIEDEKEVNTMRMLRLIEE